MANRQANVSRPGGVQMSRGQALDTMIEKAERWANGYRGYEPAKFERDFVAKFSDEAERLAERSTLGTREFGKKDWLLAVLLWCIIAGGTLTLSILLMQPNQTWFWVFVGVAVAIFAIGLGTVYWDTTNPKRAEKRRKDQRTWLLQTAQRAAERIASRR
ncbi:hypothetical protein [Gulosibacter bifidus]|uniref:DUF1707 domain-containing protein n=1 Tax=Gulosibacter bifidus TaxID=272239 RepID=A0ABW5RJZ3_9MICO|nr:hypothetical protein [Gulosibacter bifidus]